MYRLAVVLILTLFLIAGSVYPIERTEAQRYYDLAVSYIKSDLYVDGLKTLNQVAFLYPDSNLCQFGCFFILPVSMGYRYRHC